MSSFRERLTRTSPSPDGRRWIYVPYDQLTRDVGPLSRHRPEELGVVLVESAAKARRRPYHKQKLALVLANMRHFALELAEAGVAVRYLQGDDGYRHQLEPVARELGGLTMMRAAERELRVELEPLVEAGLLEVEDNATWLTSTVDFEKACGPKPPYRMDRFYRYVRKRTGLMMEAGEPEGGRFSFDDENRRPWPGTPPAPRPLRFDVDEIKREVKSLVDARFGEHPGAVELESLPATRSDARAQWRWALEHALPSFGPFEDAMSSTETGLFHTRVSALVNLGRLLPREVVDDVAWDTRLSLPSREGFVRQVLGWREFVRHVHEATDGFRALGMLDDEGAAAPNGLGADIPLPPAYWGKPSGLRCLDTVVESVFAEGYSHHITRLMVLSNIATLLGVSPRELTDWFWIAYTDAYDWVVEPNVLGMGTFSAGDLMTTKPYVSGAAYIDKMSDYCRGCAFHPKKTCPITAMYWHFLHRNEPRLRSNPRLKLPLASSRKRSDAQREEDAAVHAKVVALLGAGERLGPDRLKR